MNGTSTARVRVEARGAGVVSHVGLHALGSFADRLGLGDCLSRAIPQRPSLVHDRGKILTHRRGAVAHPPVGKRQRQHRGGPRRRPRGGHLSAASRRAGRSP